MFQVQVPSALLLSRPHRATSPAANLLSLDFSHDLARLSAPRQAIARASSGIRTSSLSFKPVMMAVRPSEGM